MAEGVATLAEVETHWSIGDVLDVYDAREALADAERRLYPEGRPR